MPPQASWQLRYEGIPCITYIINYNFILAAMTMNLVVVTFRDNAKTDWFFGIRLFVRQSLLTTLFLL